MARGPALSAALLGLLAGACGQRYEIGELLQPIDVVGDGSTSDPIATLVADGVEDADAALGADPQSQADTSGDSIGDVDGDGFDDWITERLQIVYGGPRAAGGTFPEPGAALTTFSASQGDNLAEVDVFTRNMMPHPAGDVDGDGYADILFESRIVGGGPIANGGTPEHWASQRAYLWYGRAQRPLGTVSLESEAVAFDALHAIRESLASGGSFGEAPLQVQRLSRVGDLDGDGFDDIAYSYAFNVTGNIISSDPASSLTRFYYGGPERLPMRGAAELPVAQLSGTRAARPLGDIDGDGFADFWTQQADADESSFVVSGGAQRLTGENSASAIGLPVDVGMLNVLRSAGDLDHDGIGDFIITDNTSFVSVAHLFYGSPSWATTPIDRALADASFQLEQGRAEVTPLGDWNGDGIDDLMLRQHVRRGDEPATSDPRKNEALWRGEMRVVRGATQRYSGEYSTSVLRSALPERNVAEPGGPHTVFPVGDLDGDGFVDAQLLMMSFDEGALQPTSFQGFIKYGGPLGSVVLR
jgi:hypothetical protein